MTVAPDDKSILQGGRTSRPVDMHVHLVGNGSGGTGCWLRVKGWHRFMAAMMLRQIGLPAAAMHGDLDRLYVERLLELVRTSSLGAAVILAHEQVYREDGAVMQGVGSFFVPNDYVLGLARRHPEFLPAVSIHPARKDALEELDRCLASVMDEVKHFEALGVTFAAPTVDLAKLKTHKEKVVGKLTGGLAAMAKMRKVTVVQGTEIGRASCRERV